MTPAKIISVPFGAKEVTYAADQPEYNPLPVVRFPDGLVISRWKLTFWERLSVLLIGDIYHGVLTFNKPLQPMKLGTSIKDVE